MIRVLFYASMVILAISAALLYLPAFFSYIILAVLALTLLITIVFKKKITIVGLIPLLSISILFTAWGMVVSSAKVLPVNELAGKSATITCVVTENPESFDNYMQYTVKTSSVVLTDKSGVDASKVPQHIKLSIIDTLGMCAEPYNIIEATVTFKDVKNTDFKGYNYSEGFYVTAYTTKAISVKEMKSKPPYSAAIWLRNAIGETLYKNLSYDEAAMASAVLLGEKSGLTLELIANVKSSGVSHMLAVSGMHFSIIFQLLTLFFLKIRIPKRIGAVMMLFINIGIMAVCGFTPSIMRAGLTYFILLIGIIIFKTPDALNSLGCATIIFCFINPFSFGSVGFLLSYAATFGILVVCPLLYDGTKRFIAVNGYFGAFLSGLWFVFVQTVSATLTTLPILLLTFDYISSLSLLTNILTCYASIIILCAGVAAVFLLAVPVLRFLALPFLLVLGISTRYFIWCINLIGGLPFATIPSKKEYVFVWFLLCGCIISLFLFFKFEDAVKRKQIKIAGLSTFLCSVLFFSVIYFPSMQEVKISILDVGKGVSVVVIKDGHATVVGAGDTKNDYVKITNFLKSEGIAKADLLVLPSLDKSFAGGAYHTVQNVKPSCVVLPRDGTYFNKLNYLNKEKYCYKTLDNTEIKISNGIKLTTYANLGTKISIYNYDFIISAGDGSVTGFSDGSSDRKQILISSAEIPDDFNAGKLQSVILSSTADGCMNAAKPLAIQGVPVYGTAGNGTITAIIKKGVDIKFTQ